jgi:hypothetical protein
MEPEKLVVSRGIKPVFWLLIILAAACAGFDSGPPIGSSIPTVLGKDMAGRFQPLHRKDAPCILFFYNPKCTPCKKLLGNLLIYDENGNHSLPTVILLTKKPKQAIPKTGFPVLTISENAWKKAFNINRTPILLFYEAQGRLVQKQLGWRPRAIQTGILDEFSRVVSTHSNMRSSSLRYDHSHTLNHQQERSSVS